MKWAEEDRGQYWMLRYHKEWVISRQPNGQPCALHATTQHALLLLVLFFVYFLSVRALQQSIKILLTYFLVDGPTYFFPICDSNLPSRTHSKQTNQPYAAAL